MKKSEVRQLLDREFKKRLFELGFKKIKYLFIKEKKDSYIVFGYSLVDSDNTFPSQFWCGFGLYSLDKLIQKIFHGVSTEWEKTFSTAIAFRQSKLFSDGKYPLLEYDICSEEDAHKMVDDSINYLESSALPYFESISSPEKLESVVNTLNDPRKSVVGLILAKLSGNQRYKDLKDKYRELLNDWADEEKQRLEDVIIFLDVNSTEDLIKLIESDGS